MPSKQLILRRSMVVGFFSFLGSLTGILVETSIAAKLGLSRSSDTFYIAFTVPYIISNLIAATGQFSLVPFFSGLAARHTKDELWRGFSYALNVVFLGLSVIAVFGAAAAPWVVRGIAPGFTPPQTELATELCQWLFFVIIPAGVAETLRSFLYSQHRFALSSATGFFRNVTVIASILLTFDRYGYYSMVFGFLAGNLLQVVILLAQILSSFRVRYTLTLAGSGEAFQNLRGAGAVQVATAMAWQGVVVIERIIASFLPPGTLTALAYGMKILSTLVELLSGSVGTASLPALSQAAARRDQAEERKTFQHTLEISLMLVSPATAFCLLLDHNIIRLVFEHGNFSHEATNLMSMVFFYYSLALLLFSCIRILTFYLFARNEADVFFRLALFLYGLTVGFDLLYVGALRLGAKGIPLGLLTSLAVTSALAYRRNLADLHAIFDRALGVFTAKDLVASGLAALTVWGLRSQLQPPASNFGNFLYLCILCGGGSLVFFAFLTASRAVSLSQLAAVWRSAEDS